MKEGVARLACMQACGTASAAPQKQWGQFHVENFEFDFNQHLSGSIKQCQPDTRTSRALLESRLRTETSTAAFRCHSYFCLKTFNITIGLDCRKRSNVRPLVASCPSTPTSSSQRDAKSASHTTHNLLAPPSPTSILQRRHQSELP